MSRDRFSRDVIWNVGGLAVAGGCGILLNYLISVVYDAAALGVFNQVFAFYLLFSQLAALGFHYSVLKHVAAAAGSGDAEAPRSGIPRGAPGADRRAIVTSALVASGAIATVFAVVSWLSAGLVGDILDSPDVARGVRYAAPGVALFALNKITLGALNGLRHMRFYAVLYAGRFVLMIAAFAVCWAAGVDRAVLPVILTASEAVILLASLVPLRGDIGPVDGDRLRRWIREHVRFGVRGFMSGMLAELNTRVDVLILGVFVSDEIVGAYSFAAILAEGLFQLLVVLRTNYAPVVIGLLAGGDRAGLTALVRRARDRTYLGAMALGVVAVAVYYVGVPLVTDEPELAESWRYFAVLVAGMVLSAGYQPFQPLLLYGGFPGWHTWLMLGIVAVNAVLNFLLITAMGPIGSAVATAAAFVAGVLLLRALVSRRLDLRI